MAGVLSAGDYRQLTTSGPPALRLIPHVRAAAGARHASPFSRRGIPPPPNRQPRADMRDRPVDATSGHDKDQAGMRILRNVSEKWKSQARPAFHTLPITQQNRQAA